MSYSWSRHWKPVWFRDGDNYQKTHVEAWTQATDVSTGLYMICGRLTNGLVISPTRKSLTRVAQGMIHEMEPRVPLLHTTLGMCGQQEAHAKGCNTTDHAINDGDAMPFNHRKYHSLIMPGIPVFIILKVVFDVHRGNQGSCWVPPRPRRPPENRSTAISNDSLTKMTSFVSRRHMEKMGFCKPFKSCKHNFGCLVLSCWTTPTLAGLGCSSARTSYLTERRSHMTSPTRAVISLSKCNQAKVYL